MDSLPKPLRKQIKRWLRSPSHESPLLIVGADNTQWHALLEYVRQLAACTSKQLPPCGTCAACTRAAAGQYPDIITVANDTKTITIKQVRALLPQLHRTTSGKRLIIMGAVERLLPAAANALLKELEESSAQNRFFLTTAYGGRLLPTIVSRCHVLRLLGQPEPSRGQNLSIDELVSRLSGRRPSLTADELSSIATTLQDILQEEGYSAALYRALLRLRDYYKIRSRRGNEKLAADVLLATLRQLLHNNGQKHMPSYAD